MFYLTVVLKILVLCSADFQGNYCKVATEFFLIKNVRYSRQNSIYNIAIRMQTEMISLGLLLENELI